MHSHDLISVSVGEIRPNGGKSIINIAGGGREILPTYSAGAHIDIIIPGIGPGSIPCAACLTAAMAMKFASG